MHRRSSQITIAAVALILGVLVVVQLRSQAGNSGLAQLSAQDLTVLVANLNARNDQLRRESSTLEAELATLKANQSRGDVSVDEITADLERVRAYAGLEPVGGPGSHLVGDLSEANALIVVPEQTTHVDAGEQVQVLVLDRDF